MAPMPPPSEGHFYGRGVNLAIIAIVFNTTAVLLVASRLIARFHIGSRLVLSDYAIVLSTAFSIGLTICDCIAVQHGSGKVSTTLSPNDLRTTLQAFWVSQIVYKFTINLTKTSICLLYLQIFPGATFRRITYLVIAYVLLYAIASIIATIIQCNPIARVWNHKIGGTCINLTAFWYANAAANILGDCIILVLPIPSTKALAIPKRQKYGLIIVFTLGAFVCVTSILRMTTLKLGAQAEDVTYGTLNSTIWTTIEANTGIVCACLPMLKAPLMAMFPRLFPPGSYPTYERSGLPRSHRLPSDATNHSAPEHLSSPLSSARGQYAMNDGAAKTSAQTHGSASKEAKSWGSSDDSGDEVHVIASQDVQLGDIKHEGQLDARSDMVHPGPPKAKNPARGLSQAPVIRSASTLQ